jgi:phage terminase large subunit GpA-like protein
MNTRLRLRVADAAPALTDTYKTTINVKMFHHMPPNIDYGVVPGHISEKGCHEKLGALLEQTWLNESGHALSADMAAIDGNAWTEDVWSFAKKYPRSKLIMVRGSNRDEAPRFIRVRRETNEKTGRLLRYASRFYNFNASIMKMGFYRDLAKEDPIADGYVSFPKGLDDEYFRQLTAERRTPEKRHGFTVYRWTKDASQANEALDTMNQAEAASIRFGVRGMPDQVPLLLIGRLAIDRTLQGLLPRQRGARAFGEQPEAVIQSDIDLLDR